MTDTHPPAMPAGWTLRHTLTGHTDWVWDVAWSPDGTGLASASRDRTARLWNPHTEQCYAVLPARYEVAVHPTRPDLLATSGLDTIDLWELDLAQLQGHTRLEIENDYQSRGET